jgi:pimeloyl-ACP methyl ester carboxylesterase
MDMKSPQMSQWTAHFRHDERHKRLKTLSCCVALLLLLFVSLSGSSHPLLGLWKEQKLPPRVSAIPFHWSQIKPSEELEYHACYDGFECARLELPMNYHAPVESNNKVALAVIRKPAKVPVSDPHYGGAILINPGGPGGSGVAKVLYHGALIQQVVDAERTLDEAEDSDKYFDIIGFDPRGINRSTPILSCFQDNFARQVWTLQSEAQGLLGSSEGSLRLGWRRARALADGCSSRSDSDNSTFSLLEHVNTTPVSADMVGIIERHGQWRERQGSKAQEAFNKAHKCHANRDIISRTKWQRGREKLQYWGFSYGTLLGSTFASMYPERVARVALDGVVSTDDYYNGPWLGNLQDTDRIFERLFKYCDQAGPDRCQFWREGGAKAIQAAYETLLHDIWDDPLSVIGNGRRGPEIITWSDIKEITKDALYQPLIFGPIMVELLQDITNGTGSLFADYKEKRRVPACRSDQCILDGPYSEDCVSPGWNELEATSAVLCTDAEGIGSFTEDEFREYWQSLKAQSSSMGDYWAETRLACAGWQKRAKWRFSGPFSANTSHPILWIGNTLDTVTPLRNAQYMNAQFPGSVLLQQDSEGHCSPTAPSLCTARAVRKYFQTGILPPVGTLCKPDIKPFGLLADSFKRLSAQDSELLDVLKQIAETMHFP